MGCNCHHNIIVLLSDELNVNIKHLLFSKLVTTFLVIPVKMQMVATVATGILIVTLRLTNSFVLPHIMFRMALID